MGYLKFLREGVDVGRNSVMRLALAGGLLSFTVPIGLSLYWAWQQNLDDQEKKAAAIAHEVLRRSNDAIDQVVQSIYPALFNAQTAEPCSSETIAAMRRLDLASDQVQTVAYVQDNTLLCSAYGHHNIPLGPPSFITPRGTSIWASHELPTIPGAKFLFMTQKDTGYTAVILSKTFLNIFTDDPEVSVGLYSLSSKSLIAGRGKYDPHWLDTTRGKNKNSVHRRGQSGCHTAFRRL